MRDTPKWQATIIATTAAFLGSILSVTKLNLFWNLAYEPASCDTQRLPNGALPACAPAAAPMWLMGLVAIGGALIGYWIYRTVRQRRDLSAN